MPATPIGLVGLITSATADPQSIGLFIEVVDDTNGSTGGAYICTWSDSVGYDDWIEHLDLVDEYLAQVGYAIEWFAEPPQASLAKRPRHA